MVEPILQTNRGAKTAGEILEDVEYGMYRRNREIGIAPHRMECLWGTTRIEAWEVRFRAEQAAA